MISAINGLWKIGIDIATSNDIVLSHSDIVLTDSDIARLRAVAEDWALIRSVLINGICLFRA